jgi:autophagy-related protein 2
VRDSLEVAYDSLSRHVHTAAHTILAIPLQELERCGPQGSMRAVIRAIPIAVLQPVVGATQALSVTLLGVRNKIDPALRKEEEDLWQM